MRPMWKLTVLLACVTLTACLGVPVPSESPTDRIKPGETTKEQVNYLMGVLPKFEYPPGTSHYYGDIVPVKWCGLYLSPEFFLPIPVCGEYQRKRSWWIQIQYDDKDVVKDVKIEQGDTAKEKYDAIRRSYLRDEANGRRSVTDDQ